MSNYEKHSLKHLKDWLHDSIGADIPAEKIYEVIVEVIKEEEEDCILKLTSIQSLKKLVISNQITSSNDYCN